MNDNYAVVVDNVTMVFDLQKEKTDTLKETFIKAVFGKNKKRNQSSAFTALQDVSFKVERGESFAIVGSNGSGKSTMLKIISGIYKPTKGNVFVQGVIAPLIELGAGFDPDLTGRENIYLNGAVLGVERKTMENLLTEIVDFAELWDFIDVPVKNYSSGMYARLGFSVATVVRPDVLIVDEILAVGDAEFQKNAIKRCLI